MTRRHKVLKLPIQHLVDNGGLTYNGVKNQEFLKLSGLPEDAKFEGMQISKFGGTLEILVSSSEFDEVKEYEEIPTLYLLVTVTRLPDVELYKTP